MGDKSKAPRASKSAARANELLDEMQESFYRALQQCGVDHDRATSEAHMFRAFVADRFGGQNLYIGRDCLRFARERQRAIAGEYDGSNAAELAAKHHLSVMSVYRAIKAARMDLDKTSANSAD